MMMITKMLTLTTANADNSGKENDSNVMITIMIVVMMIIIMIKNVTATNL